MGGFYRTRGSNRFGVLITFHVLTHVIDLKNPRPPRWGGSLEPMFPQNPPPPRWGGSLEPMFPQNPVLATGIVNIDIYAVPICAVPTIERLIKGFCVPRG